MQALDAAVSAACASEERIFELTIDGSTDHSPGAIA
jgi:hypothetical protein